MKKSTYPLFCPIAMASNILEPRWTLLVLCEMSNGSTRFSDIQRGVPGMSPGLLSKRLKDMEVKGLVQKYKNAANGYAEYFLTPLAKELQPIISQLGEWAHRNIESNVSLEKLDARMLMWNIRRKINSLELPSNKCVIQFILKEPPNYAENYWLIIKSGQDTDIC